jgi:replicative DNA helicase
MSATTDPQSLPQNDFAEKSVLGAVLIDEQHLNPLLIDERLRPDHFFRPAHAQIFAAIIDLYEASARIDYLTVSERLHQKNELDAVGGQQAVEELLAWVPASGHAREYGKIVRDNARMRGLVDAAETIKTEVLGRAADPRELMDRAEKALLELAQDERQRSIRKVDEVLHEEIERLQWRSTNKTAITGTPSGFKKLDELTGGFQPGNLIIVAARPSMGKSALVANFAENAALANSPVVFFSLEMSETELAQRFVASQAKGKVKSCGSAASTTAPGQRSSRHQVSLPLPLSISTTQATSLFLTCAPRPDVCTTSYSSPTADSS